mmetsp:Transcript_39338/g.98397  ORF Transcript_39338/g.98397 Transcript_39338/m.98397 type:complete len:211 (-) Transcript_39338:1520-2152(-)
MRHCPSTRCCTMKAALWSCSRRSQSCLRVGLIRTVQTTPTPRRCGRASWGTLQSSCRPPTVARDPNVLTSVVTSSRAVAMAWQWSCTGSSCPSCSTSPSGRSATSSNSPSHEAYSLTNEACCNRWQRFARRRAQRCPSLSRRRCTRTPCPPPRHRLRHPSPTPRTFPGCASRSRTSSTRGRMGSYSQDSTGSSLPDTTSGSTRLCMGTPR